jgi:hypothetical protein
MARFGTGSSLDLDRIGATRCELVLNKRKLLVGCNQSKCFLMERNGDFLHTPPKQLIKLN